jgi:hypothetical protein
MCRCIQFIKSAAISFDAVEVILMANQSIPEATEVQIDAVDLSLYDSLLQAVEVN